MVVTSLAQMRENDERMPRVAILGIGLEAHRWAPRTCLGDFEAQDLRRGLTLLKWLEDNAVNQFVPRLRELRDFHPVPLVVAFAESGGPCDHDVFTGFVDEIVEGLCRHSPIDAVYIIGHGAGITTDHDDLDGLYFAAVREVVGPNVPIVVDLDYHANISDRMLANADVIVGYRTNPHVDMAERSRECAEIIHEMLGGLRPKQAAVRLPLVLPQIAQLTAPGQPCGDLMSYATSLVGDDVLSVSIFPGFAFSDTSYNGFTVVASSRTSTALASSIATDVAKRTWAVRSHFDRKLTSLDEAVQRALSHRDSPQLILADVADNPGGGGRCNTTWLLSALCKAGATQVALGLFYDPALVRIAQDRGVGDEFHAQFNSEEKNEFSRPFVCRARVANLTDGKLINRHGMLANVPIDLGPSCLLDLGGILVAVTSKRAQIYSPDFFTHFGVNLSEIRCFVVKSRGHFRAGFEGLTTAENILEVDAPGLTTPNLLTVPWAQLPRPAWPLDREATWAPHKSKAPIVNAREIKS